LQNINSKIYKWTDVKFTLYRKIPTNGAFDWEYFSIAGTHFLALANYSVGNNYDGTYDLNSKVYKWDAGTEEFSLQQEIATHGANDWEYFTIGKNIFLAAANCFNDETYDINSMIYRVIY
jgi:hypothetical protein